MKQLLSILLLTFSGSATAEWVEFSARTNGDIFYFDNTRVEKNGNEVTVWTRVKYKTSIMGASSYQSLLKLNCSENSEITLQSTFYSDTDWKKPAMATNSKAKPKINVEPTSAIAVLIGLLCKE